MSISSLSVKRPVTTVMVFVLIILLGIISWKKLPQELFPPLVFPQVTIMTSYPNAGPEEIETLITKPIEEIVGTVKNLKRITSKSKEGVSLVSAEFGWNTNMDLAAMNVREKIDLVKKDLPLESDEPIVMKFNPFEMPIMIISITGSKNISSSELLFTTRRVIKDRLEKVDGVASVSISGGVERQILVEVDQNRLQANNISIIDVVESIKNTNLNYPAGTTKEKVFEYLVRTIGEYASVQDMHNTIVDVAIDDEKNKQKENRKQPSDQKRKPTYKRNLVTLASIATITDTIKERTSFSRYNARENISVSIQKQSEANTIRTADQIKKMIDELKTTIQSYGISMTVVYDQSSFIKNSISGLITDSIIGGFLAFLVILFFLMHIRSSIIVCFSIPVSVMASFILMYMFDISINMMSLGGLALGVGMLVDNAIVVVENIFRHAQKKDFMESSIKGTEEIGGAIFASTATTICVFLPLLWVIGIAGQIFRQLSLTITFSLTASLLVAMSLVPRLMSTLRKKQQHSPDEAFEHQRRGRLSLLINNNTIFGIINSLQDAAARIKQSALIHELHSAKQNIYDLSGRLYVSYTQSLTWFLRNSFKGLGAVIILFVLSIILLVYKNREFLPKIDQHQFIVKIEMPVGTRLELTDGIAKKIEDKIAELPETKTITTTVGSNSKEAEAVETMESYQGQIIVTLKKSRKDYTRIEQRKYGRPRKTYDVIRALRYSLATVDLERADVSYLQQDSVFKSMVELSAPVTIKVQGYNLNMLRKLTDDISEKLASVRGIRDVRNNMPMPSPETRVVPDKDRAATYNLSVSDIARTALIAIKGFTASKFKEEGDEIDIVVRLHEKDRNDIETLRHLTIHSPMLGMNLPIKDVASLEAGIGPSEILRQDRQRTVIITADVYKRSLKDTTNDVKRMLQNFNRVSGFSVSMSGETERIKESFKSLLFVLAASIILVYMVMAAQFESLWQPFVIMFTIPLSLIGVAFSLWISNNTLNAISMLGIIILGGIVVNNGIVLVDFVNKLKGSGTNTFDALILGSQTRIRPIAMTALTTILGLAPLALGFGEGAELRAPMAITVIGGLLVSTFLTLYVIPVIYLIMEKILHRQRG